MKKGFKEISPSVIAVKIPDSLVLGQVGLQYALRLLPREYKDKNFTGKTGFTWIGDNRTGNHGSQFNKFKGLKDRWGFIEVSKL